MDRLPHFISGLRWWGRLAAVAAVVLALVWGGAELPAWPEAPSPFHDNRAAAGIDFRHQRGASDQKHLVETVGSGCALFDYDNDGWLDILLINGGLTPESTAAGPVRLVASPIEMSDAPFAIRHPPPRLDEHHDEVLGELAERSGEEPAA